MNYIHGNRRLACCLLIGCLSAASLAGCGGKQTNQAQTAGTAAQTAVTSDQQTNTKSAEYAEPVEESAAKPVTDGDYSEVRAGICVLKDADTELTDDIKQFLTDKGISEDHISLNTDAASSSEIASNAKDMLAKGQADVLFVDAGSADAVRGIADAAAGRGAAVIFIGTAPSSDEIKRWSEKKIRAFYSGADTSQTASLQGSILTALDADDLDSSGNKKAGALLIDSDEDKIADSLKDSDIKLDVLDNEDAGLNADTAQDKVKDALDEHKDDLEVIICGSDAEALSAIKALQDADKTPGKDVFVVGAGATADGLNAVNDGTLAGTVYADAYEQARKAVDAADSFLTGKGKSGFSLSEEIAVTQSNVQEIIDYKG